MYIWSMILSFLRTIAAWNGFLLQKYQGQRTGKLKSFEPEVVSAAVSSEAVVGMLIFGQSLVPFQVL